MNQTFSDTLLHANTFSKKFKVKTIKNDQTTGAWSLDLKTLQNVKNHKVHLLLYFSTVFVLDTLDDKI